jgi:hypothetical protein
MRSWPSAGILVWALAMAAGPGALRAQDAAGVAPLPRPAAAEAEVAADEEALLGDDALDELVGPVALYPDSLLTQVLVAATYPLDIVKADRFIDGNAGLSDKERADQAEAEDWDASIQVLAGGFPAVVQRMADDLDWTEQLGDAVLTQPDDVLDAVQRMRARAEAVGNLESNEAQVVETEGDTISIAPASPDVVYVPSYDPAVAYTTPVAAPVVTDTTGTDLLTTGVIAFGSALLVNEIFDDDDDWDDYWDNDSIDWDDADFYPRPDIDIDDVNIDRGDINIDRGEINRGDINIDRDNLNIDRDNLNIDRSRDRVRIGDNDGTRIDRGQAWRADPERREAARDRVAARDRPGQGQGGQRAAAEARLKARGADSGGQAKLQAAVARREAAGKPPVAESALRPKAAGKPRVDKAAHRGARSIEKSGRPKPATARAAPSAKAKAKVHRPTAAKKPARKAPQRSSAFHKSSGGAKAHAASRRGHASRGGGRGGRGGGGGGRRR